MRVLFVSNYPHLPDIHGGLQTTTHDLCLAIQAMGAAAGVLCGRQASGPDAWQKDSTLGYPVWRATQPEHALAEVAARWQASAIVVQTGTSLLPMVVRSLATGLPTAVYLHNVETHQLAGTLTPDPSLRYFANSAFASLS